MASYEIPQGIDALTVMIEETLDKMIGILHHKKDYLIQEIRNRHKEHEQSKSDENRSLEELERLKKQISFEQNNNHKLSDEIFASIEAQMNNIKDEKKSVFDWEFIRPSIDEFNYYVNQVFTIDKKDKFQIQSKAILQLGHGLLNGPMKLALDKATNQVYVPDALNQRIQIFSPRGEPSTAFGFGRLNFPCSVDLDDSYCYVADSAGGAIHQFSKREFKLTRSQKDTIGSEHKSLSLPVDIKVDSKKLYVSDLDNNRVCVFTDALTYSTRFGQEILHKPQYVQFHNNKIFVIDGGEKFFLHIFNQLLHPESQFEKIGINYSIVNPKSFCFSPNFDKIVVADFDANKVKVLEIRGKDLRQKYQIGKDASGGEVIDGCMGVIMFGNQIVVSCQKPSCLKVFGPGISTT